MIALLNSSAAASVGLGRTLFLVGALLAAPLALFYLAAIAVAFFGRHR